MLEWLEMQGLALVNYAVVVGIFVGAFFIGAKAGSRWGNVVGWICGILSFVLLGLVFYPATEALLHRACQIDPLLEDCY